MASPRTRLRPLALAAMALLAVALAPRHALVRHHHAGGGLAHVHLEGLDLGDHHHHAEAGDDHDAHHHGADRHHDHLGADHDDHDHAVARHHLHRLRHASAPSLIAGGDPDHTHWQDPFHRAAAPTPPVLAVATTAVRLVAPATPPPGRRPGLAPSSRGPPALLA